MKSSEDDNADDDSIGGRRKLSIMNSSSYLHQNKRIKKFEIFYWLLKQITLKQWFEILLFLILLIHCLLQCLKLYRLHKQEHQKTSITYELPEHIEFPAITLCVPIIVPFDNDCLNQFADQNNASIDYLNNDSDECSYTPLTIVFNKSISIYKHQCKLKLLQQQQPLNCQSISPIIENYYHNHRCLTYLNRITTNNLRPLDKISISNYDDNYIQLSLQTNQFINHYQQLFNTKIPRNDVDNQSIRLYVHQIDQIPLDLLEKQSLDIRIGYDYHIDYYQRRITLSDADFFGCHNYKSSTGSSTTTNRWAPKTSSSSKFSYKQMYSQQDCHDHCFMQEWRHKCGDCFPKSIVSMRKDLINLKDKFCSNNDQQMKKPKEPNNYCPNPDEMVEKISENCNRLCPKNCHYIEYELRIEKFKNKPDKRADNVENNSPMDDDDDETSSKTTKIIIKRSNRLDTLLLQMPGNHTVQFLSHLGGLLAFYLIIYWLIRKLIQMLSFLNEVYQLNSK